MGYFDKIDNITTVDAFKFYVMQNETVIIIHSKDHWITVSWRPREMQDSGAVNRSNNLYFMTYFYAPISTIVSAVL